jgi:hypothetical protein
MMFILGLLAGQLRVEILFPSSQAHVAFDACFGLLLAGRMTLHQLVWRSSRVPRYAS